MFRVFVYCFFSVYFLFKEGTISFNKDESSIRFSADYQARQKMYGFGLVLYKKESKYAFCYFI